MNIRVSRVRFIYPTLRQRKMPPVRDGIFCFKVLRIHSHKRENKKCRSRRRQTAAAFFFDSASPFRGSPERSGGNPRKVRSTCNPRKRCEFIRKRDHRSEAEVIPLRKNSFAKPPLFIIFKKLIKTKWLLLPN